MEIGDKVRFLNDVGGGVVRGFKAGGVVMVEDEDGFQIPVLADDLVVITTNEFNFARPQKKEDAASLPKADTVSGKDYLKGKNVVATEEDEQLEARVIRLEMQVSRLASRVERLETEIARRDKERRENKAVSKPNHKPVEYEVDLHAFELLPTTSGMAPHDIMEHQMGVFRKEMDSHLKEKGCSIVFIHGKGNGVLRRAILDELKYRYKSCESQDASFQQYGFGATRIIIK